MKDSADLLNRTLGALMGLAIGDALGAPVENLSRQTIAQEYPDGFGHYVERPGAGLRPGQGTDDTDMAFLVAASLVEKRQLEMPDIVARLVHWGTDNAALGPSTGAGIAALTRGVPWEEAGQTAVPSSGCLPRCAPIALFAHPDHLLASSLACCRVTHRHPLALSATVTLNLVLERLVRGLAWEHAFDLDDDHPDEYRVYTAPVSEALRIGPAMPGALEVLVEAFRCVDQAASAAQAIEESVQMGGDTDTRAAVAGALAGARWGIMALPRAWIDGCEMYDQGRSLALGLYELKLQVML